jgi:hypothetical protein
VAKSLLAVPESNVQAHKRNLARKAGVGPEFNCQPEIGTSAGNGRMASRGDDDMQRNSDGAGDAGMKERAPVLLG